MTEEQIIINKLKKVWDNCLNTELRNIIDETISCIGKLQEENEQLKDEVIGFKDTIRLNVETIKTLNDLTDIQNIQLNKSKEIIKNLIDYPKRFGQASGKYHHECELAEQFLKDSEVEK